MNKIKDTIEWFKSFGNKQILVKTDNNAFTFLTDYRKIPHLLGLQYAVELDKQEILKGSALIDKMKHLSDNEIYSLVQKNNPNKLSSVKKRVKYLKPFLENLDKALVVERTRENTSIKSPYFFIQLNKKEFLQLGFNTDGKFDTSYFQTFIVRKDDIYFKDSTINEKVKGILEYKDGKYIPFSFKKEKELTKNLKPKRESQKAKLNKYKEKVRQDKEKNSIELNKGSKDIDL